MEPVRNVGLGILREVEHAAPTVWEVPPLVKLYHRLSGILRGFQTHAPTVQVLHGLGRDRHEFATVTNDINQILHQDTGIRRRVGDESPDKTRQQLHGKQVTQVAVNNY